MVFHIQLLLFGALFQLCVFLHGCSIYSTAAIDFVDNNKERCIACNVDVATHDLDKNENRIRLHLLQIDHLHY